MNPNTKIYNTKKKLMWQKKNVFKQTLNLPFFYWISIDVSAEWAKEVRQQSINHTGKQEEDTEPNKGWGRV